MTEYVTFGNRSRAVLMSIMCLWCALFVTLSRANADSPNITYYTISSKDHDADNLALGKVDNEVQKQLGPDGLPVLNTPEFGCTSNCFSLAKGPTNLISSGPGAGEITYWDPSVNPFVTQTGTGVVPLPFNTPVNFFPPNGTGTANGGSNGYQAAELFGDLTVPSNVAEDIKFNIRSDDMAFVYLNGQVVCDDGGVHPSTPGVCTVSSLPSGTYAIQVFFVDINQAQAGLTFGIETSGVTTSSTTTTLSGVPEPGTLGLLGLGLAGVAFAKRRNGI